MHSRNDIFGKSVFFVFNLAILISFAFLSAGVVNLQAKEKEKKPFVDAASFKYIDNFDNSCPTNLIGGSIKVNSLPPSKISLAYSQGRSEKGSSLKVNYILSPNAPAYLIIGLNNIDISQAYGLSFWISKLLDAAGLTVSLKDGFNNSASVSLERYLARKDSWQKVSIMKEDFPGIDFNNLVELTFELSGGDESIERTILFDDIAFFGPSGLFFESIKDNLRGFPVKEVVNKKYLLNKSDEVLLKTVAQDTWNYFNNLVDRKTQLPVDWVDLDETKEYRIGDYTSPTNIGLYFLSIIGAQDLGFIDRNEALVRISKTLDVIKSLPRWNGLWYNWYSTTASLIVLRQAFPEELGVECSRLLKEMDFSKFFDPIEGKLYLGFELDRDPPSIDTYHYGLLATESRLTSFIAIAKGDITRDHWFRMHRTLPRSWEWQTQIPQGEDREYFGMDVFEGYYKYKDSKIVPSWGGSLFEFLMPTLLMKEKELAPEGLGLNNANAIKAHIDFALKEKKYPVWGISPCSTPDGRYGGYAEFGVAKLGAKGYKDEGVITPHASVLALGYLPDEVKKNVRSMLKNYNFYGEYGPYDSFDVSTKKISSRYLCLDQGMLFISLANYLSGGKIQERFHSDPIVKNAEYLLTTEKFY
ncbi:MAG: hypothetical protein NTZ48_03720 [Candidatus Omnitrophica bacterium]|nr:hypothetical protein [Candidatus Omnitrophota bacterium]